MDQLQQIHLSMYSITYRTPLYLVIFLIIICTISLFYPLYRLCHKKLSISLMNVVNYKKRT